MAFKRVIIRRVGPLSWLLGAMIKKAMHVPTTLRHFFLFLALILTACSTTSDLATHSKFSVTRKVISKSEAMVTITVKFREKATPQLLNELNSAWHNESKAYCGGDYQGKPVEIVIFSNPRDKSKVVKAVAQGVEGLITCGAGT